MPRARNGAAEALSRTPPTEEILDDKMKEIEINDFIDAELSSVRVLPVQGADNTGVSQSQAGLAITDGIPA